MIFLEDKIKPGESKILVFLIFAVYFYKYFSVKELN